MMLSATMKTRIAAITGDEANIEQVISALNSDAQQDFDLVDVIVPTESLFQDVRVANPSMLLVDYRMGEQSILDVIDDLSLELPEVAIIAIIPGNDPLIAQQVTLAGARAFLPRPFTQVNLLSTLRRVRQLTSHQIQAQQQGKSVQQVASRRLRTVTVFSSRGGAGCSTIAVNLAVALRDKTNSSVLLMGGSLFFGHLEVMLNIKANSSLADLIPHAGQLDETLIRNVVVEHASGINVLLEPFDIHVSQGIRPEELYKVVQDLKRIYDFLVIDAGNDITENSITLMDSADRVLFVTTPELGALRNLRKFKDLTKTLSYSDDKVLYLLNRAGMKGGVKAADIENLLGQKLFTTIPDNHPQNLMSLNRGIPMVINHPRSKMSQALYSLAEKLGQMPIEQIAPPRSGYKPSL